MFSFFLIMVALSLYLWYHINEVVSESPWLSLQSRFLLAQVAYMPDSIYGVYVTSKANLWCMVLEGWVFASVCHFGIIHDCCLR
jgi:hypothetical protein